MNSDSISLPEYSGSVYSRTHFIFRRQRVSFFIVILVSFVFFRILKVDHERDLVKKIVVKPRLAPPYELKKFSG